MEELNDDLQSASDMSGGIHGGVEGAVTDKALQNNLENLNKETTSTYYEPEYVELPHLNLDTVIASNKSVHDYLDEYWIKSQKHFDKESEKTMDIFEPVDNKYRLFRRSAQKEVNYLVKEFECRKSADAYALSLIHI